MTALLLALPGAEPMATELCGHLNSALLKWEFRRFPDGESYLRILGDCAGQDVVLVAEMSQPDEKFLPLVFAAQTVRDLGAKRVILVAPYLPYMRQDTRFRRGEGVTARYFARLLSAVIDGLVTVDPHLHRIHDLAEVYTVPSNVVGSAPAVAEWIARHVVHPLIVGPDEESEQWVGEIASALDAPYVIQRKRRLGDRALEIDLPDVSAWRDRTAVLVDDIISTGTTLARSVERLRQQGLEDVMAVAVHALFCGDALATLDRTGLSSLVTANTVVHASNDIDLSRLIAEGVRGLLSGLDNN